MSNSSRSDDAARLESAARVFTSDAVSRPLVGLAFWAAIALPFLHLPMLISGLETTRMTMAFLILLAANVVALVVGHSHGRE